jgi:hypothetical protein
MENSNSFLESNNAYDKQKPVAGMISISIHNLQSYPATGEDQHYFAIHPKS